MYGVVDSLGIMFKPIAGQFHWDRGTVSMASMINWITFGLSGLLCGALSDRFGSRGVMIVGGLLLSLGRC